jgi:hypothetical protein
MQIHIITQVCENYGAHDWDGDGQCPQYWKNKGGDEYIVIGVPENATRGALGVIVSLAKQAFACERHDDYFREYVVGWELKPIGTWTQSELDQMDYDGKIECRSQRKLLKEIFA